MSRISKEKRNHVILAGLLIATILAGLYFGLIRSQQRSLREITKKKETARQKQEQVATTVRNASLIAAQLAAANKTLSEKEANVASGDLLAWMINTVRKFKRSYDLDIPNFSTILVEKNTLLPDYPYQQVTMSISGTGYYFELGRFVADLENQYPTIRVENLDIVPASTGGINEPEKLLFRMNLVALVKPGQ
jgi:Tfp pilus assembly protein PilO